MVESQVNIGDRIFRFGTIRCGTGRGVVSVVRNLSKAGAVLEVENGFCVPNEFTLIVEGTVFGRSCRVAWRESKRIGVEFV
jgi:hypothetical protein